MNYNLKATYTLTDNDILALFWTALTSGSIGYGYIDFDTDKESYEKAREAVMIRKAGSVEEFKSSDQWLCVEDVWTEVLRLGKLVVREYDDVDDANNPIGCFGIEDLYHNLDEMQKNEHWILEEFAKHQDDANTHDAFLQYVLLGEIVYG